MTSNSDSATSYYDDFHRSPSNAASPPGIGVAHPDLDDERAPLLRPTSSGDHYGDEHKRYNRTSRIASFLKKSSGIIAIFIAVVFLTGAVTYHVSDRANSKHEKQLWEHERQEEILRFELEKQTWTNERDEQQRQIERDREALGEDYREQQAQFKREKKTWAEECRQEQLRFEHEKEKWALVRKEEELQLEHSRSQIRESRRVLEQDRKAWHNERRRREENEKNDAERRQRADLAWTDLEPDKTCLAHRTRNYQAKLQNVPLEVDGVQWCHETSIEIFGVIYEKPKTCSMEGEDIVGHWTVDNDAYCHTTWTDFHEKGCTMPNSGLRRYEAKLDNFHRPDWPRGDVICATTPAIVLGKRRDSPDYCFYYEGDYGHAGAWDVPDADCA